MPDEKDENQRQNNINRSIKSVRGAWQLVLFAFHPCFILFEYRSLTEYKYFVITFVCWQSKFAFI